MIRNEFVLGRRSNYSSNFDNFCHIKSYKSVGLSLLPIKSRNERTGIGISSKSCTLAGPGIFLSFVK